MDMRAAGAALATPAVILAMVILWRRAIRSLRAWWRHTPFGDERPPIPQSIRIAVLQRDGWQCRECGARRDLEIDHVFPWSRGGDHTNPDNLEVLCHRCNHEKGARVPSLWARLRWFVYLRRTS